MSTGAAVILFGVNTAAAGTGRPSAVATSARSGSPLGLMPRGHAGGDEPGRRGDAHGYSPDERQAGGLVQAEDEVGALDGLARRALDEVVERGAARRPSRCGRRATR